MSNPFLLELQFRQWTSKDVFTDECDRDVRRMTNPAQAA